MNERDRIMYYKDKYKISNFTTYQDLRHAIYDYEMKHFVDLVFRGKDKYTHEFGLHLVSL